jgi:hypothetical protein
MPLWNRVRVSKKTLGRVASILVVTFAVQYGEYWGMFANMEGAVLDKFLRRSAAHDSPVIIVEIDDEAYRACFSSTSPIAPDRMEAIVDALLSVNPSVLGVDIMTDLLPASQFPAYGRLASRTGDNTSTVWAASSETTSAVAANFFAWLFGAPDRVIVRPSRVLGLEPGSLPEATWAVAVYLRDEDLRLRRVPRRLVMSADPHNPAGVQEGATFARQIAELYCRGDHCKLTRNNEDEVYFSYGWPIQRFAVTRLFQCPSLKPSGDLWPEFTERAGRSIVLLGGTFSTSNDIHSTPVGSVSGLYINAQAINSEIAGTVVAEVPRYVVLILDLLIGCLIVLIFTTPWTTRRKIELSLVLVLVTALASGIFISRGFVWLTWTGIAVGLCPHLVWEFYHGGGHAPARPHADGAARSGI